MGCFTHATLVRMYVCTLVCMYARQISADPRRALLMMYALHPPPHLFYNVIRGDLLMFCVRVMLWARRVWGTGLICTLGRQGGGKGGSDPGNCSVRNLFYGVALVAHHPLLCSSCSNPCHTEWILGTTPDTAHGVSTSCRLCQLCMLDCKQKPWLQDGRVCVRCRPSNAGHRPKYTRPGNGDKCNPVSAVA